MRSDAVIEIHGARIPLIGIGTWPLRGRECADIVERGLRIGYRHIDTAELYENEREVGDGLRLSGIPRDAVFLTSKIMPAHFAPHELDGAAKNILTRLRVSEVDLLLLHWPSKLIPLSETVGALCAVKRAGLTRHIGLSNFAAADVAKAVQHATEPLVCNQIKVNSFRYPRELIAACRAQGLAVVAYSPIAEGQAKDDSVLVRIGRAYGKTAAQISLRWLVQQGIAVIPRTSRIERLAENCEILDFALSDDHMSEISVAARRRTRLIDVISPVRELAQKTLPEPAVSLLRVWYRRVLNLSRKKSRD
jgi:2,5-diketo-D-gluconate reductase B